jgi:hypothetical protein
MTREGASTQSLGRIPPLIRLFGSRFHCDMVSQAALMQQATRVGKIHSLPRWDKLLIRRDFVRPLLTRYERLRIASDYPNE